MADPSKVQSFYGHDPSPGGGADQGVFGDSAALNNKSKSDGVPNSADGVKESSPTHAGTQISSKAQNAQTAI